MFTTLYETNNEVGVLKAFASSGALNQNTRSPAASANKLWLLLSIDSHQGDVRTMGVNISLNTQNLAWKRHLRFFV